MRYERHDCSSTRVKMAILVFFILCTVFKAESLVVERRTEHTVILSNEELNEKQIGPANQYELLNSFPSLFSTDKKVGKENLLLVYDSNMLKHFPFLTSGQAKSITVYEPYQVLSNVIGASERSISIPSINTESLFDDIATDMKMGCSQFDGQQEYVISESMLSSGSFGHIWMARNVHDHSLFILKRIRIEKGLESLFSARREIFMGTLFRGTEGVAQYKECFIQDMGLLMNHSPSIPDRVISIPWLVFHYEGVSLNQMIYTPSASEKAYDEDSRSIPSTPQGSLISRIWKHWTQDKSAQNPSQSTEGMIVRPSKFWEMMRNNDDLYKVIIYKICLVLRNIHKTGVIHRDIKPENVLISHLRVVEDTFDYNALTVNLIDFGSSILPAVPALYPIPASIDQCTKLYAPPEASTNNFSQSYDIWSLGVMMLEMIFGHRQFFECEPRQYAKMKILHGDKTESKCYSLTMRSYCVSAVESGPAMADCVKNVMIKTIRRRDINFNYKGEENQEKLDLIRSMLVLNPKKRITIDGVLNHPYFSNIHELLH